MTKVMIDSEDQRQMLAELGITFDLEAKAYRNTRAEAVATILCLGISVIRELTGPDRDDPVVQEYAKHVIASLSAAQPIEKDAEIRAKLRPILDIYAGEEEPMEKVIDHLIANYICVRRVKL